MSYLKLDERVRRLQIEPSNRLKLIVGVDYGTTYSGIAYTTSDRNDYKDVTVNTQWPARMGRNTSTHNKVPSSIAFAAENSPRINRDVWGYEVKNDMIGYSWTKLLLDKHTAMTEHDDPSLQEVARSGVCRLPAGKTAEEVVEAYLRKLYNHCMERLEIENTDMIKTVPIEFWFTVPATWSDEAKYKTKRAAERAGFGKRSHDEIKMIMEPEAAAISTLKSAKDTHDSLLQKGTCVMICDCGGGTVDITTYNITKTEPLLELEEACPGLGGKCGGTYVDRNLYDLLAKKYGTSFTGLSMKTRGPGSIFMREYDSYKEYFDIGTDEEMQLPLLMEDIKNDTADYDARRGMILLKSSEMKACFDPVVKKILDLISQQVKAVKDEGLTKVKTLVLVGGFAQSPYLWNKVRNWCHENGNIMPMCPSQPADAIAKGAALRGLSGPLVHNKRCRRHYGISLSRQRRQGEMVQLGSTTWTNAVDGFEYITGYMYWQIGKNERLEANTVKTIEFDVTTAQGEGMSSALTIYSCSLDTPSEWEWHPRAEKVGTISFNFSNADLSQVRKKTSGFLFFGTTSYKIPMKCNIAMGIEDDLLKFEVVCQGTACGSTTVKFAHS